MSHVAAAFRVAPLTSAHRTDRKITDVLSGYPKLRDDLNISRQDTPEGSTFIIKDPTSRRFFRFGETEHLIAQPLDGATSLAAVQPRLEGEFGLEAGVETLQQFVEQLRRPGLLQTAVHARPRGAGAASSPEVCSTSG